MLRSRKCPPPFSRALGKPSIIFASGSMPRTGSRSPRSFEADRTKSMDRRANLASWLVLVVTPCLAATLLAAVAAPELPNPGNPRMTRAQQEQLGLQAAAEVYKQMPVLPDSSPETKYIQDLGTRLYKTIPPEHSWPFQFHVVAQKEINAFALPGGPMFVNVGTIATADNEAQLAGVMAHEMAHVYMQHSAKQQEKASLIEDLAGVAGAVAGMKGGTLGTLAQSGVQFGAGTLMLKYSRGDEAQADAVGAIILWKAGYNPVALAEFFEKLATQGGTGPQFLSDHPNPGNRRNAIEHEIAEWPAKAYSENSPQFAAVHKEAANVTAYSAQEIAAGAKSGRWAAENRKNGAVFPGLAVTAGAPEAAAMPRASLAEIQPSSSFRSSDLGLMRIDRPENWEEMRGQQSGSVVIAPKTGVAGGAVAYGVVIEAVQVRDANISAQELTARAAQSLQASDTNMKQSGEIQQIAVDGVPAGSVELETISRMAGADGKPQREHDWLVAVPREKRRGILFLFVAPTTHFEQMRPAFEKMVRSVRF